MNSLVRITPVGGSLYLVEQITRPTDPGYGGGRPRPDRPDNSLPGFGHPDQDLPGFNPRPDQGLPGYGHPDHGLPGYGHPDQGLPVPPPAGVVTPPINLPSRPQLPAGSGIVVPLPDGVPLPTPPEVIPDGSKPYVLWYGPGTQSTVVYLKPSSPSAQPK
jgi:hypothetical protein